MEARIKSCDSARSLAQLVRVKRIILFIVRILRVIYKNPKSFRYGNRTLPSRFVETVSPCLELVTHSQLMHTLPS